MTSMPFFGEQPLGFLPQGAGDDVGYAQVIQPFGKAPGLMGRAGDEFLGTHRAVFHGKDLEVGGVAELIGQLAVIHRQGELQHPGLPGGHGG